MEQTNVPYGRTMEGTFVETDEGNLELYDGGVVRHCGRTLEQ